MFELSNDVIFNKINPMPLKNKELFPIRDIKNLSLTITKKFKVLDKAIELCTGLESVNIYLSKTAITSSLLSDLS